MGGPYDMEEMRRRIMPESREEVSATMREIVGELRLQLAAANEKAGRLEAEREELTIAFHALEPAAHDGRLIALYGLPSHESYKTFARILGGA